MTHYLRFSLRAAWHMLSHLRLFRLTFTRWVAYHSIYQTYRYLHSIPRIPLHPRRRYSQQ